MTCTRCPLILAFVIAVLCTCAFANQKDDEAKALVQRAMNISAIREEGSPPFRLRANVKITQEDGSVVEGTYTETWVSNTLWRRETALGDFRRTQVVAGRKTWTSDSSNVVPERLAAVAATFDPWLGFANTWKADKFGDHQVDGNTARCFRTKRELWGVSELCFENNTGALAERIVPVHVRNKNVDGVCIYQGYQPLGDRKVPTSYSCSEDKKLVLQAQVIELALRPQVDDRLFAALPDGKEAVHCPTRKQPPTVIHSVEPPVTGNDGVVTLALLVGVDGRPHDLRVANSLDPTSDTAALEAVRQWRFRPATCEGQPMEVEIAVEIDFHSLPR